jgi:hypothetical protein
VVCDSLRIIWGHVFRKTHMGEDYLVNQAVKRVCEAAEQIGEITFDQLNALLPAAEFTPEQIEQLLNRLAEKGIRHVED